MRRFSSIISILFLVLLSVTVGCSSKGTSAATSANTNIIGAGSTFVYPIMTRWIANFQQSNPNVQINYQSIGSGGGIQQLKNKTVDFAASDAALSDEQLKTMPPIVQIPESAGPVCITYNLPDLKQPLKLSSATLAGIYLGDIKNWQDVGIRKDNPGVQLPKLPVIVAHRSDGSGTTNIFTTYLDMVTPRWHAKVGKGISVSWPAGLGGKGSEGVTGIVKQQAGGIGYVELTYASQNNLPVALIQNKAGKWVAPTSHSTTAAINAFASELAKDVRTPIVDPPASAPGAYPISGFTFLFLPKQPKNAADGDVIVNFTKYILGPGQDAAPEMHYSKLPDAIRQSDEQLLQQVSAGM